MAEKDKNLESHRESLVRRLSGLKGLDHSGIDKWDGRNKGLGFRPGKNAKKRREREAHRIDRLAHIAHERRSGNEKHVPKMKRVPRHVFE